MDTSKRPKSPRRPPAPKTNSTRTAPPPAPARARLLSKPGKAAPPTHQQIAERAYLIHLGRGGHHGSEAEDWLQAERELATPRLAPPVRKRTTRA